MSHTAALTPVGPIWHVFPLGFCSQSPTSSSNGVDARALTKIENWFDYMKTLSLSTILLGPVFESETHGYDTIDHFKVDTRLGDNSTLVDFIKKSHDAGLKVILDGVFNHVSRKHFAFADVLENGQTSQYSDWFHLWWNNGPDQIPDYEHFEGHTSLPVLNYENEQVRSYIKNVIDYWNDQGVDGWRLDAAYAINPIHLGDIVQEVKNKTPNCFFLGEVIHGDYSNIASTSHLDSVTQYELWKAIWSSLNDQNLFELSHSLTRHNQFLESFVANIFLGNHDVTRIASMLSSRRELQLAFVILTTIGGLPSIYYGDEQAFVGFKEDREGGDDAVRPTFPETPHDLSKLGNDIYEHVEKLMSLRQSLGGLLTAKTDVIEMSNTFIHYRTTSSIGQSVEVALTTADGHFTGNVENGQLVMSSESASYNKLDRRLELPNASWAIFV